VSVFPLPVGARMSVESPHAQMAGQPFSWAGVGAANVELNQSRIAGVEDGKWIGPAHT
jgi:hypothetical protein